MTTLAENPLLEPGPPSACRRSTGSGRSISGRPSTRRWRRSGRRSMRIADGRRRRPSPTPSSRWRRAGLDSTGSPRSSSTWRRADTNEALQAVEREMAPLLARHGSAIYLERSALRAHRRALAGARHARPRRRAASACSTATTRSSCAPARRSTRPARSGWPRSASGWRSVGTQFSQNVLADENGFKLVLEGEDDLAGLPDSVRAAAAEAARERGLPGKHVITLSRSSIEPFLQFSTRRDLREKAFEAWVERGENGGDRQPGADRRDDPAARRAGAADGLRQLSPTTASPTRWRRRRRRCANCCNAVWEPAQRRRRGRGDRRCRR